MKIKQKDLKIGDVLYPIIRTISDKEVMGCGVVTEKFVAYAPLNFEPIDIVMINFANEGEDGLFTYEEFKLGDNEEFNVIFRKN